MNKTETGSQFSAAFIVSMPHGRHYFQNMFNMDKNVLQPKQYLWTSGHFKDKQ